MVFFDSVMDHECEFLNTFFSHLSHLCFDKAKEHLEREKEACKSIPLTPWAMLLTHLPQMLLAEKSYIELGCLTIKNKGFLRKENSLRAIYDGLRVEMKRLEEVTLIHKLEQEANENFGETCPIPYYIAEFLTARIDLIDLYEKLFQLGCSKLVKYTAVVQQIDLIKKKHEQTFTHIALTPMKAVVTLEIEILYHLLEALDRLQKLEFIPSITQLYGAHTRIIVWENSLHNRETWKLGFGATFLKNNPQPLLFQWLVKLKCSALSKLSLYFHNTLAQQTTTQDMRQLCAKQQVDYYSKILSFHRRYDVTLICLLYDNRGYETEDAAMSNAFSVIVCYPTKNVIHLIDNFIKIITEKTPDLSSVDKYAFLYNAQDNHTYTIANIEPRIHILLIFDGKRTEKDIYISNFITELSGQLRFVKNFTNLKISSK